MKRALFFGVLVALTAPLCFSSPLRDLLGIWNLGPIDQRFVKREFNSVKYLATYNAIEIDDDYPNSETWISFDGFAYQVLKVKGEIPTIDLFVSYSNGSSGDGTPIDLTKALARAHFVDRDHVWFEIVLGPDTDSGFPKGDFVGNTVVYWRAKKVE